MLRQRGTPLLLALVLALSGLVVQQQVAGAAQATEHPEIEASWETCDNCHLEVTPEVVEAWFTGSHGLNSVKCFVCHGAAEEEFASRPGTEGCSSCHLDWVETMERDFMAGKDCYSCHEPHGLSPHLGGTGGAER